MSRRVTLHLYILDDLLPFAIFTTSYHPWGNAMIYWPGQSTSRPVVRLGQLIKNELFLNGLRNHPPSNFTRPSLSLDVF